ncbi:unnamed protein product [Cuscuta epithymum]|uniref:Maternal effect embryo arrest 60 n=1 Tax=Cuscuta epithymum TaxID=186058 RepID=A0AAV0EBP8_9ASTE|nr:unnamed protein product [Cuscuta epithymum]CAH9121402.1 unnamed protein product [Cuscuta epithymum]
MTAISIHVSALDGIIHVNSLFTFAVFVGLAWNPRDPNNRLTDDPKCEAGPKIAEDLVAFHVYSFASFLFSSLIAMCIKQVTRLAEGAHVEIHGVDISVVVNKFLVQIGYGVCAVGSVAGCVCLMLALRNVVEIKLGTLGCGSPHTSEAVYPLFIFGIAGLIFYVLTIVYAFFV